MLYLYRSCGLAAEWIQQDSCSELLSLNHDTCCHSHHCLLHRSLQGNRHSQSDKPCGTIHHRCRLDPFSPTSMHACVITERRRHSITGSIDILFSRETAAKRIRSRSSFQILRGTGTENGHRCSSWMRLTMREMRRFLWIIRGSSQKIVWTLSVYILSVHVCFCFVTVNYIPLMVLCTAAHHEARSLTFVQAERTNTTWKKPFRHFKDKKAISATWSLCWVDWFERGR